MTTTMNIKSKRFPALNANGTRFLALMQREWLQHRFGWAMLVLIPLALALLLSGVGQIQFGDDDISSAAEALPSLMATISIVATTGLIFVIASFSAWIIVAGIARRDHADRSIEFWLSVPASHVQSLAAPMLVHLLLVPAAALLVGLLGGYAVSFVLVSRVVGAGAWFGLPWGDIIPASMTMALRLLAGLPLLLLWFSPLILMVVLFTAWFKRWAWVIMGVGIGLGSVILKKVFGQPLISDVINGWLRHGVQGLVHGGDGGFTVANADEGFEALRRVPGWALHDFGLALHDLASPLLLAGLGVAAVCFVLLVQWRQRGAGAAG